MVAEAEVVKLLLRISVNSNYVKLFITCRFTCIFLLPQPKKDKSFQLYTHARICYLRAVHDVIFIYRYLICKREEKVHVQLKILNII